MASSNGGNRWDSNTVAVVTGGTAYDGHHWKVSTCPNILCLVTLLSYVRVNAMYSHTGEETVASDYFRFHH